MERLQKLILAVWLALCSASVLAETDYEKIKIGTVLAGGIGLGSFVKPIPLPAGEWLVVNKRLEEAAITSTRSSIVTPTPRILLTLKNNHSADALLFGFVMAFTPEASNINWNNRDCASSNPKILVDDFGFKADSMLYVCSYTRQQLGVKDGIAKVAEGKDVWAKNNLAALAAYRDEIPDNALFLEVFGNQYNGRNIYLNFIIKREGDLVADPGYVQYAKDWAYATGLSLAKVLNNSSAEFVLPAKYAAKP